jgi:RES domain-containing protein
MKLWRVCKAKYAATALRGQGGLYVSGRWHQKGTLIVYCARSLSLATLESFVHFNPGEAPDSLVAIAVEVPDDVVVEHWKAKGLPRGWRGYPHLDATRTMGTTWVKGSTAAVLRVPSAIVPIESNFLLNPSHPEMARVRTDRPRAFAFNPRMLKP